MNVDYEKLLQGRYETELLPMDFSPERSVPDFAFNVLNPLGFLYRPVVDEYFITNGRKKPYWPGSRPFAVCLTHDLDNVSLYSLKQALRRRKVGASSAYKKIRNGLGIVKDLTKARSHWGKKDPLHCYERWLELEKKCGLRSTLFLWPGWNNLTKHHHSDCSYDLSDLIIFDNQKCTVAEMICDVDRRGWEIGLHPSWYAFDDVEELKRQKGVLERVIGHEIVSVRQHYLHYDIRVTPRIHALAGLKYDSTLGFNDNVGFRFGTCYPWHLYDLQAGEHLPILEIPLLVQDLAMLNPNKGMRLDREAAFRYVTQITEAVQEVGGVLTLLWHLEWIIKPDWLSLYQRILKYLQGKDPWFATMREIGKWWNNQMKAGKAPKPNTLYD